MTMRTTITSDKGDYYGVHTYFAWFPHRRRDGRLVWLRWVKWHCRATLVDGMLTEIVEEWYERA